MNKRLLRSKIVSAERSATPHPVRYAVVGLGHFAQSAVLPAFERATNSKLAALISGDTEKLEKLGDRYQVAQRLDYASYDAFLGTGAVDAVYIALPNSLHRDYAVRAALAGVHVLCEKPMALRVPDCERMIEACYNTKSKLMLAYRLHFERAHLSAIQLAQSGRIGDLLAFHSLFSLPVRPGNIRTQRELGGGPLYDIGIYCINAARYLFRAEPREVTALLTRDPQDPRFREIESQLGAVLKFPDGRIATFSVSFQASHASECTLLGSKGKLRLEPAYSHTEDIRQELTVDGKTRTRRFPKGDQVAAEIAYFSDCILNDEEPEPTGFEGLCDVRIIEALQQSARERRAVELEPLARARRPEPSQQGHVRPHGKVTTVNVEPPSARA